MSATTMQGRRPGYRPASGGIPSGYHTRLISNGVPVPHAAKRQGHTSIAELPGRSRESHDNDRRVRPHFDGQEVTYNEERFNKWDNDPLSANAALGGFCRNLHDKVISPPYSRADWRQDQLPERCDVANRDIHFWRQNSNTSHIPNVLARQEKRNLARQDRRLVYEFGLDSQRLTAKEDLKCRRKHHDEIYQPFLNDDTRDGRVLADDSWRRRYVENGLHKYRPSSDTPSGKIHQPLVEAVPMFPPPPIRRTNRVGTFKGGASEFGSADRSSTTSSRHSGQDDQYTGLRSHQNRSRLLPRIQTMCRQKSTLLVEHDSTTTHYARESSSEGRFSGSSEISSNERSPTVRNNTSPDSEDMAYSTEERSASSEQTSSASVEASNASLKNIAFSRHIAGASGFDSKGVAEKSNTLRFERRIPQSPSVEGNAQEAPNTQRNVSILKRPPGDHSRSEQSGNGTLKSSDLAFPRDDTCDDTCPTTATKHDSNDASELAQAPIISASVVSKGVKGSEEEIHPVEIRNVDNEIPNGTGGDASQLSVDPCPSGRIEIRTKGRTIQKLTNPEISLQRTVSELLEMKRKCNDRNRKVGRHRHQIESNQKIISFKERESHDNKQPSSKVIVNNNSYETTSQLDSQEAEIIHDDWDFQNRIHTGNNRMPSQRPTSEDRQEMGKWIKTRHGYVLHNKQTNVDISTFDVGREVSMPDLPQRLLPGGRKSPGGIEEERTSQVCQSKRGRGKFLWNSGRNLVLQRRHSHDSGVASSLESLNSGEFANCDVPGTNNPNANPYDTQLLGHKQSSIGTSGDHDSNLQYSRDAHTGTTDIPMIISDHEDPIDQIVFRQFDDLCRNTSNQTRCSSSSCFDPRRWIPGKSCHSKSRYGSSSLQESGAKSEASGQRSRLSREDNAHGNDNESTRRVSFTVPRGTYPLTQPSSNDFQYFISTSNNPRSTSSTSSSNVNTDTLNTSRLQSDQRQTRDKRLSFHPNSRSPYESLTATKTPDNRWRSFEKLGFDYRSTNHDLPNSTDPPVFSPHGSSPSPNSSPPTPHYNQNARPFHPRPRHNKYWPSSASQTVTEDNPRSSQSPDDNSHRFEDRKLIRRLENRNRDLYRYYRKRYQTLRGLPSHRTTTTTRDNELPEKMEGERNAVNTTRTHRGLEEELWELFQGESHLQDNREFVDDSEPWQPSLAEDIPSLEMEPPLPYSTFKVIGAKLKYVINMLRDMEPKENYIQTLENCLSSSRTNLKSQYDVEETIVNDRPGFSGALFIDAIFVARDWGVRKKPLKHSVYTKACQLLTSQPLERILFNTDPGPEVQVDMSGPGSREDEKGLQTNPSSWDHVTWKEKLAHLCDWLADKPEGNGGPINTMLTAFRKSGCDLKYSLELEPVSDERGVHVVTKCKFRVEGKLLACGVGPGKRQAKTTTCQRALDLLKSQDLDTVVKSIMTKDGAESDLEAQRLIEERSKSQTTPDLASALDSLISKARKHACDAHRLATVAMDTSSLSSDPLDGNNRKSVDAVTLLSKLCIQMKVKLTTVFKRVALSFPQTADDHQPSSCQGIACMVYVADRLLASCQSSSRRDAHWSAFQSALNAILTATGNELLNDFPILTQQILSAPEVIDVVYKGHTKTTESNRHRFHRLHKQPEVRRSLGDLVLLEHEDWTADRFRHAHCMLSQSATRSGLLLEWTLEQRMGSFSCEMSLQGQTVARCVTASKREAVNLASAQALFSFFETQPVVQVFHPDYPSIWVTRAMIVQGLKVVTRGVQDTVVINIEGPEEGSSANTWNKETVGSNAVLDSGIAASIERHVSAFFHQSTLREFVSSPDWTPAERNHLRHLAYVRGLRCFTAMSLAGEIVVLSMRLDLWEHVTILTNEPHQCQGRYRLLPDSERPSRGDVAGELAANESVFIRVKDAASRGESKPMLGVGIQGNQDAEIEMDTENSHYLTANTTCGSNSSATDDNHGDGVTSNLNVSAKRSTVTSRSNPATFLSGQCQSECAGSDERVPLPIECDVVIRTRGSSGCQILPISRRCESENVQFQDGVQISPSPSQDLRYDEIAANSTSIADGRHPSCLKKSPTTPRASPPTTSNKPLPIVSSTPTPSKPSRDKGPKKDNPRRSLFASVMSPVLSLSPSTSKLLASCRKSSPCRKNTTEEGSCDDEDKSVDTVRVSADGTLVLDLGKPRTRTREERDTCLQVGSEHRVLHI